ncbi:MAG: FG-GAP-like repeat-containing protein, partial [Candidatus Zixiibacteriota bacterium]
MSITILAAACLAGDNITDLGVTNITHSSAVLTWTAPGEDGFLAPDAKYEIRFSDEEITDRTFWMQLRLCPDPPQTKFAGAKEIYMVEGLNCNSDYYFAVKYNDSLSNVISFTTPPGIFAEAEKYRLDTSQYSHWEAHTASYVTAVNVNADNYPDLVVVNGEEFLSVMLNNGDGSFAHPSHYRGRIGGEATMVVPADFNGDGNIDLAMSYYSEDAVGVFLNYGNGEFYFDEKYGKPNGSLGLCAEDFNRDGDD